MKTFIAVAVMLAVATSAWAQMSSDDADQLLNSKRTIKDQQKQIDDLTAKLAASETALQTAQADATSTHETVATLEKSLQKARADLDQAREDVEKYKAAADEKQENESKRAASDKAIRTQGPVYITLKDKSFDEQGKKVALTFTVTNNTLMDTKTIKLGFTLSDRRGRPYMTCAPFVLEWDVPAMSSSDEGAEQTYATAVPESIKRFIADDLKDVTTHVDIYEITYANGEVDTLRK